MKKCRGAWQVRAKMCIAWRGGRGRNVLKIRDAIEKVCQVENV